MTRAGADGVPVGQLVGEAGADGLDLGLGGGQPCLFGGDLFSLETLSTRLLFSAGRLVVRLEPLANAHRNAGSLRVHMVECGMTAHRTGMIVR